MPTKARMFKKNRPDQQLLTEIGHWTIHISWVHYITWMIDQGTGYIQIGNNLHELTHMKRQPKSIYMNLIIFTSTLIHATDSQIYTCRCGHIGLCIKPWLCPTGWLHGKMDKIEINRRKLSGCKL
jgi:hypothetical protein